MMEVVKNFKFLQLMWVFSDSDGNSTVSYGGQTARMDMLSEMTSIP